jgi:hypothetical protein
MPAVEALCDRDMRFDLSLETRSAFPVPTDWNARALPAGDCECGDGFFRFLYVHIFRVESPSQLAGLFAELSARFTVNMDALHHPEFANLMLCLRPSRSPRKHP